MLFFVLFVDAFCSSVNSQFFTFPDRFLGVEFKNPFKSIMIRLAAQRLFFTTTFPETERRFSKNLIQKNEFLACKTYISRPIAKPISYKLCLPPDASHWNVHCIDCINSIEIEMFGARVFRIIVEMCVFGTQYSAK